MTIGLGRASRRRGNFSYARKRVTSPLIASPDLAELGKTLPPKGCHLLSNTVARTYIIDYPLVIEAYEKGFVYARNIVFTVMVVILRVIVQRYYI